MKTYFLLLRANQLQIHVVFWVDSNILNTLKKLLTY